MPDLRTALSEALSAAESPGEPEVSGSPVPSPPVATETEASPAPQATQSDRARDEAGRFATADKAVQRQEAPAPAPVAPAPVAPAPEVARPSTWKKEYWPLYDKLALGQALTPEEAKKLADYTNERESQFKSGVSTYKAEADKAKVINDAIAPFVPDLQRYGIDPGQWIQQLAGAHRTLAFGSPQEKAAIVHQIIREYQIPPEMLGLPAQQQAPQLDPQAQWLVQQVQQLNGQVGQMRTLQEQREQQQLQDAVTRVRDERGADGKPLRPHFETVREQMAGLLQAGMAQSLEDAYDKAVRMAGLWEPPPRVPDAAAVVAKAKAAAISPRSASPRGMESEQPKGRREQIAAQLDGIAPGRV